jgi:hypothetical protein
MIHIVLQPPVTSLKPVFRKGEITEEIHVLTEVSCPGDCWTVITCASRRRSV